MQHTRDLAVQILNDVSLCNDANKKAEYITQLSELLVRKDTSLLSEFLPEMVQLQLDPSALVRKSYATFLGQAAQTCGVSPGSAGAALVQQAAASVTALLKDASAMVIKASLGAASILLRAALALLGCQPTSKDVMSAWEAVKVMQQVGTGLLQSHPQEGVRIGAAKLVEVQVLLYTSDTAPQLPGHAQAPSKLPLAAALGSEAASILRTLLDILRPGAADKQQLGPVIICAIKSAAIIATSRPALMGRVLPALLALAKEGGYKVSDVPDEPTATRRGSEVSVGNVLRGALGTILRSRQPASVPWRDRLVEAMTALGAGTAAESSLKFVARQEYKDHKASKQREREGPAVPAPDAKRQRTDTVPAPATPGQPAVHGSQPAYPAHLPTQPVLPAPAAVPGQSLLNSLAYPALQPPVATLLPPQPAHLPPLQSAYPQPLHTLIPGLTTILQPSVQAAAAQPLLSMPPPTPPEELMQLHMMLPAVLESTVPGLIPAFLDSLCTGAPVMLADLVIALMITSDLPSLEDVTARMEQDQQMQSPRSPSRGSVPPATPPHAGLAQGSVSQPGGDTAGVPSIAAVSSVLKRNIGSGVSSRHLPPGTAALPPDLPPLTATAPQVTAPTPPSLAAALSKGAPLVPPEPLTAIGLQALRVSAIRRIAAAQAVLPSHTQRLWTQLFTRLATEASCPDRLSSHNTTTTQQAADTLQEVALQSCVSAIASGQGLDLALTWLDALAAQSSVSAVGSNTRPKTRPPADQGKQLAAAGEHKAGAGDQGTVAVVDAGGQPGDVKMSHSAAADQQQLGPEEGGVVVVASEQQPMSVDGDADGGHDGSSDQSGAGLLRLDRYEAALLALLEYLSAGGMWTQLKQLFGEAPILTAACCTQFLSGLIAQGGDAASVALTLSRDTLLGRPMLREAILGLVLDAAYDADSTTRSKAVRLCCNQLAVSLNGALAPVITSAARTALDALLAPPSKQQEAAQDAQAVPGEQEGGQDVQEEQWTTEEAERYCELYATLCVRSNDLLPHFMSTYTKASPPVQAALLIVSETLAKALGHSNAQLVNLVTCPIPGSEPLINHMLEALMTVMLPSEAMLTACRSRVARTGDVSALAPVVASLSKGEVLGLLPRLLQVPDMNFKALYRKLATQNPALGDPLFSPAELLVALHALDPRQDNLPAKVLVGAVDAALHAPDVFPQQAVAKAIQQMEGQPVLPLLFMRSVITALKALPKLRKFIAELLARLISRQIWQDAGQWRGFLLLIENTGKPYYPLLLQLPAPVLATALGLGEASAGQTGNEPRLAQETAVQLATWSQSPDNKVQVVRSVVVLLEQVLATHQARKAEADAAAVSAAAAATTAAAASDASPAPTSASDGAGGDEAAAAGGPAGAAAAADDDEAEDEGGVGAEGAGEASEVVMVAPGDGEGEKQREMDEFDLDFDALEEEEGSGARDDEDGEGDGDEDGPVDDLDMQEPVEPDTAGQTA